MSSPRKKHRFLNVLFLIFVLLVTLWLVLSSVYLILQNVASKEEKLPSVFGYQISVEMGNQMGDTVSIGSVVLAKEKLNPSINDVILYQDPSTALPVTGRIDKVLSFDEDPEFSIVFDAEEGVDEEVPRSAVYGEVVYTIPYLGYVVDYLNSFNGILYAVLIPGICMIVILIIKMAVSIRAAKRIEEDEDNFSDDQDSVEQEFNVDPVYHNEELDAVWKGNQVGNRETGDILTDQDMVYQLSNLNNTFAVDSAAALKQEEVRKSEAEKIVSELALNKSSGEKNGYGEEVSTQEREQGKSDYDNLVSTLGLDSKDSSDLISMLRQYGVTDEEAVESVRKAAPFVRPVMTDHSVDLNLENTPAQRVKVLSDETGKYLIIESDRVETKIKLPF